MNWIIAIVRNSCKVYTLYRNIELSGYCHWCASCDKLLSHRTLFAVKYFLIEFNILYPLSVGPIWQGSSGSDPSLTAKMALK